MAELDQLVRYLDTELRTREVPDSDAALNGLQLANSGRVTRIASAVDFSLQTVTAAIREQANLLIVHHGMFWRGAQALTGRSYDRVKAAIAGDLAVYSSHIPLDLHPTFGNNVLLAKAFGLEPTAPFGRYRGVEIGVQGTTDVETADLVSRVSNFSSTFATTSVATPFAARRRTRRWAIVTGAGASPDTLAEAREYSVDTLIVGEGTHHSAVEAIEHDLVVIYGGHYATETLGVRTLALHVAERFGATAVFVDVPTGL